VHIQLAQVRLSYMDRVTLSTLHRLDEPLSLAMASSLECSTLPPVILMERRGHPRSLPRSSFGNGMSEGFAQVRLGSAESIVLASLLITASQSVSVSTSTSVSLDSGERKDGDNNWSLWDGTAKVDEVGVVPGDFRGGDQAQEAVACTRKAFELIAMLSYYSVRYATVWISEVCRSRSDSTVRVFRFRVGLPTLLTSVVILNFNSIFIRWRLKLKFLQPIPHQ
jgi:hypothetical protein